MVCEEPKNHVLNDDGTHCIKCKQRFLYDNGLPFNGRLSVAIDSQRERIRKKKASLIIIDGAIGEGKTTMGVAVAEYFQGCELDFKCQYGFGGEDFQEKLQISMNKGYITVIYDEAGDFNKRGALTKFNQMLNRIFETFRAFKILVIVILPKFDVLDNSLFDKRIPRFLIHCHDRGENYGKFKVFSLNKMFYLKERMRKLIVKPIAYKLESPNSVGHFLDLLPRRSMELETISMEGKKELLSDNIIANKGLLNYKALAKDLSRSAQWVRNKIQELKIKPVTVYKSAKYFHGDTLGILEAHKVGE